ncbi:putative Myosin light chain kinase, smooth muscle [Blattamonas nauphoetae]|uniref:non-specific serine/threonine protein kinase n=1 Tax=Blattamonas nauphoetae TaxID=2049346 RepID=A0ABQ9XA11_9EUKA|nr:putative Myosin light chain kinase, smooth muscle [Blattamonas nauphoetae]
MTSKLDEITPPGYSNPRKLNSGAFGQVLKVTHDGSGVEYAVKVLPMLKEGDKERVSREVEMLTRFAHARIVHLHESIDMGGHHAIVMELGTRSLKDLISEYESRGELIPLPWTVMILVDICEGLLWMHTHPSGSTAHGDLKPENVLLRENNRAFLCDLGGSAAFEQHMTQTTGEFGTFEYNSPERVMDSKGTGTAASDVWSLGVVAYRMVTGRGLFEGLTLPQLCLTLGQFNESRIPTSIPASVRAVLVKMLEPNLGLRATSRGLLEGGLLEGMLGSSTDLSRMKSIQLGTLVNEIKESLNDAEVEERTMKLEMEKEKLLLENQELKARLRSLQNSLERTRSRNIDLEKEEEVEQYQLLTTNPTSPISISTEDNVLSAKHEMPTLQFYKDDDGDNDQRALFDVSGNTITRTGVDLDQEWKTALHEERISEGVVSVAITVLAIPEAKRLKLFFGKCSDSQQGLMFGLVDALSRELESEDKLGFNMSSSIAIAPKKGKLLVVLPSTKQDHRKHVISAPFSDGAHVVLEVDMDARPRTAVFIVNGNVPLTFVSGLPPSIRFGLSMKNEGVSVRFDGLSRLKRATPLRRVNEIKWNPEDLRDSDDMYMNGMRSSVLTVQTQMPSLVFTDPSHFNVEDNRIASTGLATIEKDGETEPTSSSFFLAEPISEGIVAISFTYLFVETDWSSLMLFGLIDAHKPIPEKGQQLGAVKNSVALSSIGRLTFLTSQAEKEIEISPKIEDSDSFIVEINMDSNPRTAQFFVNAKSASTVVVGLPESVRVGFSAEKRGMQVRFDRITRLNRGSPITDLMEEMEWPTAGPLEEPTSEDDSEKNDENETSEADDKEDIQSLDDGSVDNTDEKGAKDEDRDEDDKQPSKDDSDEEEGKAVNDDDDEDADDEGGDVGEDIEHHSEQMMEKAEDDAESDGDSEDDSDEEKSEADSDSDNEDDGAAVKKKRRQLPTMKLPELLFTYKSHFTIRNNVLTRTDKGTNKKGKTRPSTVLISEPITKGVVSVTFVALSLVNSKGLSLISHHLL